MRSLRYRRLEVKLKRILLLSAYHAESHRYWCETLISQFPQYEWNLLSLPARYFSWRIRGNPLSFIHEYKEQLAQTYDLCIATSMVDLATLKAIIPGLGNTPCLVYFHENQFAYPASDRQHDSLEPKMVNLYTALAADKVLFNSQYNQDSFCVGVEDLLSSMPDCVPRDIPQSIIEKSAVLPVPLQLVTNQKVRVEISTVPKILWNHRWEYDKGPDLLLEVIRQLHESEKPYRLAIVGQQFRQIPPAFEKIKTLIDESKLLELEQWGYLQNKEDYQRCLAESDMVLSTAMHDFQGLAVLEAVAAGCIPVLPNRLVYPEWFAASYLYSKDARPRVSAKSARQLIEAFTDHQGKREAPDIYALLWKELAPRYQKILADLLQE